MRSVLLVLTCALCACGGPEVPLDAAVEAGVDRTPAPPAPPFPPNFLPCPTGWREAVLHGTTICEPFPTDEAPTCSDLEVALLGETVPCQPAQPCPTGDFPDGVPMDAVFARPGATGGDGSRDRPFGTLAEAMPVASAGRRTLVLGEGEFVESSVLRDIPEIVGLCPERSRIRDPSGVMSAAIVVSRGTSNIRGVHLSGPNHGLWIARAARATISGSVVEGDDSAIRLDGAAILETDRVRVIGPGAGSTDPAITVLTDSMLTLRHTHVSGGAGGIFGFRRTGEPNEVFSTVTIEDSAFLDTPYGLSGRLDVTVTRSVFERVGFAAIVIPPRTVVLRDVRARSLGLARFASAAPGFLTNSGGTVTLERVAVSGLESGSAILAFSVPEGVGMTTGTDVFVSDDDELVAVQSNDGTSITLERIHVAEVNGTAFQAVGATLALTDVRVTDARLNDIFGDAFSAYQGGTLTVARATASPERTAVLVADGSTATVTDLEVVGGTGIQVQCDETLVCPLDVPSLTLDRVWIHDGSRFGVSAIRSFMLMNDVIIERIATLETTPNPGMGILSGFDALVRGSRVRVDGVEGVGVIALRTSRLELEGLEVLGTRTYTCAGCPSTFGDGIASAEQGVLVLGDFSVSGSARAGIAAAYASGTPSFRAGLVESNGIGVLTDESIDPASFTGIEVGTNGTRYDRTDLSITPDELGL